MRHWREWSEAERRASAARAAHLFMNMTLCEDCGLDWPEGLVHFDCPGPAHTFPHPAYLCAVPDCPAYVHANDDDRAADLAGYATDAARAEALGD